MLYMSVMSMLGELISVPQRCQHWVCEVGQWAIESEGQILKGTPGWSQRSGGVVGVRRKHTSHRWALLVVGVPDSNPIQSIGKHLDQESEAGLQPWASSSQWYVHGQSISCFWLCFRVWNMGYPFQLSILCEAAVRIDIKGPPFS